MSRATANQLGLDASIPTDGRAANAYAVACTAGLLMERISAGPRLPLQAARHATQLHRISGWLHRLAERACNEDLTCPACQGEGAVSSLADPRYPHVNATLKRDRVCRSCAGTGRTTGRREARLEAAAREIAEHYGLRVYFKGDPRGCALYLIDPAIVPPMPGLREIVRKHGGENMAKSEPDSLARYWISYNYNRGHAIARLGV